MNLRPQVKSLKYYIVTILIKKYYKNNVIINVCLQYIDMPFLRIHSESHWIYLLNHTRIKENMIHVFDLHPLNHT
jgi:hypothetical protein